MISARPEDRQFVGQSLQPVWAFVLSGGELARRQVEQGHANHLAAAVSGCHSHEKGRLARVEVVGIGQRAGRHDAYNLALDEALGLPRVFDLVADGDAEALFDEPADVSVDRVKRNAAHRDAAAVGILGAGCQRQLERAGRDEGVLVEHFVEVAHPEQEDGIAVLLLGVQVLTHRRRCRR